MKNWGISNLDTENQSEIIESNSILYYATGTSY